MSEQPPFHPSLLPSATGPPNPTPISILLINPNSTPTMTAACLSSIRSRIPPFVTVYGFTAPAPSPTAIEGHVDAVLSSSSCLRALLPILPHYNAFLIACFSAHPLIPALREEVSHTQPVVGIMEAALYASRMCGTALSVLTTSRRSAAMHDQAIRTTYGLGEFSVGCLAAELGVLELESRDQEEVKRVMREKVKVLVKQRRADCVCLGCAGMTEEMGEACREVVGDGTAMVVDGVGVGVQFLVGLVREGLGTAKGGVYASAKVGREGRGQEWY